MCLKHERTEQLTNSDMGFDSSRLKQTLECFIDDIAEESADLIVERPRFAYAVALVTDDNFLYRASSVRQLDVQEAVTIATNDFFDDEIARALQKLEESNTLLGDSEQSEAYTPPSSPLLQELDASAEMLRHAKPRTPQTTTL